MTGGRFGRLRRNIGALTRLVNRHERHAGAADNREATRGPASDYRVPRTPEFRYTLPARNESVQDAGRTACRAPRGGKGGG